MLLTLNQSVRRTSYSVRYGEREITLPDMTDAVDEAEEISRDTDRTPSVAVDCMLRSHFTNTQKENAQ